MLDFCATPRHANCWGSAVTPLHAKGQLHAPAAVIPAYPLNGRLGEQCRSTGSTMATRVNTRPRPRHTQITLSYKIVEYCISTALGTDVYSCSAHRSAAVQVLGWVHTCNYSPGVDSASNRNEYQEYFLGGKGGQCVGLTTLPPSSADCLEIWEPQPPGTLRDYPGL